jgi:PAS domain-containing protein
MSDKNASIINIAVIGGGPYCKELLEKTTMDYSEKEVNARMKAVADPDPNSLGILTAKKLGLTTVSDYHELYDPDFNIQLFIILTPEQDILEDILRTKPPHIRVQAYHVFNVFWKAISIEEQKLRQRNEEIETILNGIQDLICVISPDFKIIDVNDAFTRTTGNSREYVVNRNCYEILHNNDHPCEPDERICPLKEVVKHRRHVRQVMKSTCFPLWKRMEEYRNLLRSAVISLSDLRKKRRSQGVLKRWLRYEPNN